MGGGLNSSGTSASLPGNQVTFFNTEGYITGGTRYPYKPIVINSDANLKALISGPQACLLFFEDPMITSGMQNSITCGSSTVQAGGLRGPEDASPPNVIMRLLAAS